MLFESESSVTRTDGDGFRSNLVGDMASVL